MNKHLIWICGLIIITIIICSAIIYLQSHSWIVRFEMDDNTLEAVKSINWTAMNNNNENCVCTDWNVNRHNCCYNGSGLSDYQTMMEKGFGKGVYYHD